MMAFGKDRDFKLIHTGWYPENDIRIELMDGERYYSPEIESMIDAAWTDARLDPDLDLYNGTVLSMISSTVAKGCLRVRVMRTDYRSFYGTNVRNWARIADPALRANALAVCAVVESKDGNVLIGKRGTTVAEDRGLWHVPGGTMELENRNGDNNWWNRIIFGFDLNPISQMSRELTEEFGIQEEDIALAVCLGLGENLHIGKPEFLCYYHLNIESVEVERRIDKASCRDEHEDILHLPMEEIETFVQDYPVAPIGKAALFCYLNQLRSRDRIGQL